MSAWLRYPSSLPGALGVGLLALIAVYAFAAPAIGAGPDAQSVADRLSEPGRSFPMGSDQLGRDQLSRIGEATRGALATAVAVVAISGVAGGLLGALSGYFGGKTDLVTQRAVDAVMALPLIVVALAVVTAFGAGYWNVTLAIAVAFMPLTVRVTRSSILALREADFISASKISGASTAHTLTRHVVPNIIGPWAVIAASQAGAAVLAEAALGFLGLMPPGRISLGGLLGGQAQTYMYSAPWLIIWPGIAVATLTLAFNLVGEWLSEEAAKLPGG